MKERSKKKEKYNKEEKTRVREVQGQNQRGDLVGIQSWRAVGTGKAWEIGRQMNQAAAGRVSEQFQAEPRRTSQEKVHVLAWEAERWPWACAAMVEFFRVDRAQSPSLGEAPALSSHTPGEGAHGW